MSNTAEKKPYRIRIEEKYVKEVIVYDVDEIDAVQNAEDLCMDGEIIFDYDNFKGRSVECVGEARMVDFELSEVYGNTVHVKENSLEQKISGAKAGAKHGNSKETVEMDKGR